MQSLTLLEAIRQALDQAMEKDNTVFQQRLAKPQYGFGTQPATQVYAGDFRPDGRV